MNNRSQRPTSKAFQEFMASSWAQDTSDLPEQDAAARDAAQDLFEQIQQAAAAESGR